MKSKVYMSIARAVFAGGSEQAYDLPGRLFDEFWTDGFKDGLFYPSGADAYLAGHDPQHITLALCLMSAIAADEEGS